MRDVHRGGESEQTLRALIDVVGADALDRPARILPAGPLACVFASIEVEGPAVDLYEDTHGGPAQVCFLTRDTSVQVRERVAAGAQNLKRADLRSAACAVNR
jgi:hypothetical protein